MQGRGLPAAGEDPAVSGSAGQVGAALEDAMEGPGSLLEGAPPQGQGPCAD